MEEEREYVHREGAIVSHSIVKGYGPCAWCLLKRSGSLRSKRPFLPESKVRHAFTWVRNCAAGQTRSHNAERKSRLQCTPSLPSSVPRASSPQPRWLFLVDLPPIRRAPTG